MQAPTQVKISDEKTQNEWCLFITKMLREIWALHPKARHVTESHTSLMYVRSTEWNHLWPPHQ